jgi:plastocyanin
VGHAAHIHNGEAGSGGGIAIYLSPIDGSRGGGTSARIIDMPIEDLIDFDGYINIHESTANLGNVVAQGNIGANAAGTVRPGLERPAMPRSTSYALDANANDGSVAPNGLPATATFLELTDALTLVSLDIDTEGATGATTVSHAAHIHRSDDGMIEYPLSPIDGRDDESRSSKIVAASYEDLTGFAGYINIHESVANLPVVVSQGNVGASAGAADVTVTLDNVGASAWEVDGASGVAGSGENPTLTLTVGTRYRFVNNGGSAHPLGFQNAGGDYLLNQNGSGSLEDDADINYEEDGDGVTFTYTQALADAVATYRCTVHAAMEGNVATN